MVGVEAIGTGTKMPPYSLFVSIVETAFEKPHELTFGHVSDIDMLFDSRLLRSLVVVVLLRGLRLVIMMETDRACCFPDRSGKFSSAPSNSE